MARDLNRLFDDLRNSREVYVAQDGTVEQANEASDNANVEERREGRSQPRTRLKPEIFGGGNSVSVADSVIARAHALAHAYPVETGAIGVGPDACTISDLIPSGPDAKRSHGSFELDAAYLQPRLDAAEARGLRFVAFWHSHPEGCSRPSGVDRAAARRMLNDQDWGLPGHVYLPISVRTRVGFATRFFVAKGADADIEEVTPVIVSDASHHSQSERRFGETAASMLSGRPEPWGINMEARLADDQESLREAGWEPSLRSAGKRRALRATRSGVVLWFVLPPEYPVSGPDVFVEEKKGLKQVPLLDTPELMPWSSLRSLRTVAEQAWKSVDDLRVAESVIFRPRVFSFIHQIRPVQQWLPSRSGR